MGQIEPTCNLLGSHHLVSPLSGWWYSISVWEIIVLFIIHWSECDFFHLQYLQIVEMWIGGGVFFKLCHKIPPFNLCFARPDAALTCNNLMDLHNCNFSQD